MQSSKNQGIRKWGWSSVIQTWLLISNWNHMLAFLDMRGAGTGCRDVSASEDLGRGVFTARPAAKSGLPGLGWGKHCPPPQLGPQKQVPRAAPTPGRTCVHTLWHGHARVRARPVPLTQGARKDRGPLASHHPTRPLRVSLPLMVLCLPSTGSCQTAKSPFPRKTSPVEKSSLTGCHVRFWLPLTPL